MTVQELIEELQRFEADAPIAVLSFSEREPGAFFVDGIFTVRCVDQASRFVSICLSHGAPWEIDPHA